MGRLITESLFHWVSVNPLHVHHGPWNMVHDSTIQFCKGSLQDSATGVSTNFVLQSIALVLQIIVFGIQYRKSIGHSSWAGFLGLRLKGLRRKDEAWMIGFDDFCKQFSSWEIWFQHDMLQPKETLSLLVYANAACDDFMTITNQKHLMTTCRDLALISAWIIIGHWYHITDMISVILYVMILPCHTVSCHDSSHSRWSSRFKLRCRLTYASKQASKHIRTSPGLAPIDGCLSRFSIPDGGATCITSTLPTGSTLPYPEKVHYSTVVSTSQQKKKSSTV